MMEPESFISPFLLECLVMLVLPLVGFILLILLPKKFAPISGHILSVIMAILTALSLHLILTGWEAPPAEIRTTWFTVGDKQFTAGLLLDNPAVIMLTVVSVISLLVTLFSISYMDRDIDEKRYFANLGLFVFSMIGIVISSNLLVLFCFWELVGLSSYLLINHWFRSEIPPRAASKAFIVNRVGDVAFLTGLAIAWAQFGTLELTDLYTGMKESTIAGGSWVSERASLPVVFLPAFGICLFLGAAGKSAQFPFQAWLPDAMAGPTPVSALIHAATMVAAGVFLLSRVFPLLALDAMTLVAVTGAVTAFMGAVAAMTQFDIKKVLAFSTISQLGYMVMGMGVGAFDASLFHLFTHAFFKAGLFLAAGAVIHAMHDMITDHHLDVQDMRNMGGLRKRMPLIFWSFLILSLALVGIPFFSGFLSKEAIMSGSFAWADARSGAGVSVYHLVPYAGMVTVALTAYYMARQVYLVFLGKERFTTGLPGKYSFSLVMRVPVIVLALLSIGLIWSFNPFSFESSWFFTHLAVPAVLVPEFPVGFQPLLLELSEGNHLLVFMLSSGMIVTGLLVAWARYRRGMHNVVQKESWFYRLSSSNWWMDEVYQAGVVMPVTALSRLTLGMDRKIIDQVIDKAAVTGVIIAKVTAWVDRNLVDGSVHFMAFLSKSAGDLFRSLQGGNVQRYIAAAVFIMIIIFWLIY